MPLLRYSPFLVLALCGTYWNPVSAQGLNGRGEGLPTMYISYYKVEPGKQDEWLALYKQFHKPFTDHQIREGLVSSTLYAAGHHSASPSWDFAVVQVAPPAGKMKAALPQAQLIRKLFPNVAEYVAAEKRRWSITTAHWDEVFTMLDPDREPLSVYEPIDSQTEK